MMIERNIKTVIVTGPTGAVGTALCSRLLQAGCTVVAVCRPGSPRAVALPKDANLYVVACDAANLADLPQCMAAAGLPVQADAFFHLAWAHTIGAGRNDMPAQIENIRYTIDAVRTAAAMGCRVFVGTGSQAEYGRVDGVLHALIVPRAKAAGSHNVGTQREAHKQVDQQVDEGTVGAHRRQSGAARKAAHHHNVCCVEQQLQNAGRRQRERKQDDLLQHRAAGQIARTGNLRHGKSASFEQAFSCISYTLYR